MAQRRHTVLIVDDSEAMRGLLRTVLELDAVDAHVVEAGSASEALVVWASAQPDLVVLDYLLPAPDGLEVASAMHDERPEVPIVLFTAFLDNDLRRGAESAGVAECATQDDIVHLSRLVRRHLS